METEVAFASPPSRSTSQRPPLGFMCLASYLEENGIATKIVDVKGIEDKNKAMEKTIKETVKLNPEIIGLTCLTPEVLDTRELGKQLKEKLPNARIMVGGVHPTLIPSDLLYRKSPIEFAIMGEGEETCLELVNAIKKKKDPKKVRGIALLNNAGKVIKTEPRPLIENLDKMPMAAFDKVPMEYYTAPGLYCVRGIPISGFYVFSSRGCPYRCEFCVNKTIYGRRIRFRSPKKVADEIETLVEKYKIDGFYFYDDTFAVNKKHAEYICDEMKKRKLDLLWACETRANLVHEDLMKKMKNSGCIQIDFGVESGSPENLIRLNKDITVAQIENAFRICRKVGIRTFANFMVNTPGETEEDLQMNIEMARKLDATVTIFNVTTPYPGNEIYKKIGGVPLEDYETLGPSPESFQTWINIMEKKYKFSQHKIPLDKLLKELTNEFPSIHSLSFKDPKYVIKFLKNISFLFSPHYLRILLKSKRKKEYAKWIMELGKYLKSQKNVSC